ncbi:hypothetical protein BT67DRAFT_431722 [Trichocladium antarcticum]|uniref:DUF7582 domain-containing protein n=1 Tax=Trichocladium antarcticum TaxID=1450529 RepID=A0AAN6URK8_9PEZI|nr:hypothetical protein BT67DRAFT_431722 [Trichocladium antarcticum]
MSSSPCLKGRISSPLEAGPSVADGHHLPNNVAEALQYASKRLGRKAPHITLLVVRRDYQLPTSPIASPTFTPGHLSFPVSTASTPSKPSFPAPSRMDALKQLVRPSNSGEGQIRERIIHVHREQFRNDTASPAFSEASTASASTANSIFSRSRWPGSPMACGSVPLTPATPFTVMSSLPGEDARRAAGAQNPSHFGMKLVYAHPLCPKEEKALSQALEKAAKKFKLDSSWLPEAVPPSRLGLPVDLVLKSSRQNETLFSSQGLSLISLDHIYTFRTALQAYARTKAACRLEDAVDELRRLFLANGRQPLLKSALLAAYRWLDPISDSALSEVCRMYERAYGGVERQSGVENDVDPPPTWSLAESNRDPRGAKPTVKRTGTAVPVREFRNRSPVPPPQPEPPAEPSLLGQWIDPLDKEIMLSLADIETDIDTDDQSDLDAIEAWYRQVNADAAIIQVDPLRFHPSKNTTPLPPPPHPETGPTPTTPTQNSQKCTEQLPSSGPLPQAARWR